MKVETITLWLNSAQADAIVKHLAYDEDDDPTILQSTVKVVDRKPDETFGERVTIEYQSVLALTSIVANSCY